MKFEKNSMKNVYDIRYEKNLTYILPEKAYADSEMLSAKVYLQTAIIIYLYYTDTLSIYYRYFDNISEDIAIYVISSREDVLTEVQAYAGRINRKNMFYILKENRGRDVSALLIAGRDIVQRYRYVCFLHDKKEHHPQEKADIDLWIANLWGNQIGSSDYIDEILRIFEGKGRVGILAPPEPIGDHCITWYGYGWHESYGITKQIAERMALHSDIRPDKPPITFGTVLWFRTAALEKLFKMDWSYSDFEDGRLQDANYLSYGLERIFAYVAQDAGYETGTVMTVSYAEKQTSYLQYAINKLMRAKDDFFPITEIDKLHRYTKNREKVMEFAKASKRLYLYGAGQMGRFCLSALRQAGISPVGFMVSKGERGSILCGIPVISVDELEEVQDVAVIITVERPEAQEEMMSHLERRGIGNYIRFWDR